jgi:ABC-type transport system involved in cytochrome c biogenesis permease component
LTLLPIADRELRVSARNKATHRWRILFATGAVTIGGALAVLSGMLGVFGVSQLGVWTFDALKWIAFVWACSAGVFLTSDCLSEEKREGTLGLLFLTDLRGHDVVLGKLLASSLRTFYSLLAIFPVMAVSFCFGGVAGDDFRHSLLAICNTLFFSLALGMVISVMSRDSHKAMTGALVAMVLLLALPSGLDWLILSRNSNAALIGLLSPGYAFNHTNSYHTSDFWMSMIAVNVAGWCLLVIASWLAPRTCHDKAIRPGLAARWRKAVFASDAARQRSRRLLDKNPICWIISRDRWTASLARLSVLLILGAFALSLVSISQGPGVVATSSPTPTVITNSLTTTSGSTTVFYSVSANVNSSGLYQIASSCSSLLPFALEFWLCAQVCRFYIDGKKTGFFELLFVTPTKPADILREHWHALRRLFLVPVAVQFLLTLTMGAIELWGVHSTTLPLAPGTAARAFTSDRDLEMAQAVALGLGAINWCLGMFTIVWFSIWMGITSKKISTGMLKTFCFAKVVPWFCLSFAGGMVLIFTAKFMGGSPLWLLPSMFQLLFIGANFVLIGFARQRARVAFSKWPELAAS